MLNTKLCALIALSLLVGIFCLTASSLSTNSVNIKSTGRVEIPTAPLTYKSEIRGVFVHCGTFSFPTNWTVIADTLSQYKINSVFGEFLGFGGGYYGNSPYGDQLGLAIKACKPKGIQVHACMTFFYHEVEPQYAAVNSAGQPYPDWVCPTKQAVRNIIKNQVETIAKSYSIDGFMFDYIRYDTDDMCYCSECKAKFQQWLGTNITDWTPFYPGGARQREYLEWRVTSITEMVRDVRSWMLAINPNLTFSIACWTLFQDSPTYWRYWLGQDTADWVGKDYLDMVAPMMYTNDPNEIADYIQTNFKYMVAGPEGKVPLCALVTTGVEAPLNVTDFVAVVNKTRSMGADGWIIWRYGGPGVASGGFLIDITPYLNALNLPDTFSLNNIQVSATATSATITWTTELPATSRVEYNSSLMFLAFLRYHQTYTFNYWDIDYIPGRVVANSANVTSHSVTLTGLQPQTRYYFRVQSQDQNYKATSKVLTFTTGS